MLRADLAPDPVLSGAVADSRLNGAIVTADPIVVGVGAGQGMAGARGRVGPQGGLPSSYAVAVLDGQVLIALSPPPAAPETVVLTVNHLAYRAPASFGFDPDRAVITWAGGFDLHSDDDVSVTYF